MTHRLATRTLAAIKAAGPRGTTTADLARTFGSSTKHMGAVVAELRRRGHDIRAARVTSGVNVLTWGVGEQQPNRDLILAAIVGAGARGLSRADLLDQYSDSIVSRSVRIAAGAGLAFCTRGSQTRGPAMYFARAEWRDAFLRAETAAAEKRARDADQARKAAARAARRSSSATLKGTAALTIRTTLPPSDGSVVYLPNCRYIVAAPPLARYHVEPPQRSALDPRDCRAWAAVVAGA